MTRVPTNQLNATIRRKSDRRFLSRLTLLLFCGAVLAGGFVFAARQHFAAVKYGYTSEALRQERERLLREEEQLLLEKQRASSPIELEAAAMSIGLRRVTSRQVYGAKESVAAKPRAESAKKQRSTQDQSR